MTTPESQGQISQQTPSLTHVLAGRREGHTRGGCVAEMGLHSLANWQALNSGQTIAWQTDTGVFSVHLLSQAHSGQQACCLVLAAATAPSTEPRTEKAS